MERSRDQPPCHVGRGPDPDPREWAGQPVHTGGREIQPNAGSVDTGQLGGGVLPYGKRNRGAGGKVRHCNEQRPTCGVAATSGRTPKMKKRANITTTRLM